MQIPEESPKESLEVTRIAEGDRGCELEAAFSAVESAKLVDSEE
jgi:hypothetical protein